MSGLLKKDLFLLKAGRKGYLLMVVIYAVCGIVGNPGFFGAMVTVLLLILPMNAFAADEQSKWDGYAAALPGGRKTMVKSKYQLVLLTVAAGLILAALVNLVIAGKENLPYGELMLAALGSTVLGLAANCITCPLMFKYGVSKGRIAMLICAGAIAGIIMIGTTMSFGGSLIRAAVAGGWAVMVVLILAAIIAAFVLSYRWSLKICEKKEY